MAVIQSANSGTTSPAWPSYVCKTRIDMQQESTHVYAPGCGMVERGTNICATGMACVHDEVALCDSLGATFARDDPTGLVLHETSDVDRTLLLLELLHFFLKLHRLHLNALDRCELASYFSNFSCCPSGNFVQHVTWNRGSLCTL